MFLSGYGVELLRLTHDRIELVRQKRNSAYVQQHMEYREEITPEMQERWFLSINNPQHNYFLIRFQNQLIGLIHGGEIDWANGITGNGGIFLWDVDTAGTGIALGASLLLTDFSFYFGQNRTYVRVLRDNKRAIDFNKRLGYILLPDQEEVMNQRYVLTRERYFEIAGKNCRNYYVKRYGDYHECKLTDMQDASTQNILQICERLPHELRARFNLIVNQ